MTGLAGHIDLGPTRIENPGFNIKVFLQSRGMAKGTHRIPVLTQTCPMQDIFMVYKFIAVDMEPSLATLIRRATVP